MPSPFLPGTKIQYAWNSSALGTFKTCARKYYYEYILGYRPKHNSHHLRFGTLYHAALELYDRQRLSGADADAALDFTVDYLLHSTWDRVEPTDVGAPWDTLDTKKNRETLIRSVIWYIDNYGEDVAGTLILRDGTPALELSFKCELPFNTYSGDPYVLTGHIDRMVTYGSDTFLTDRKTTGSTLGPYYFEQYSPDNQMSLYIYAARVVYNTPVTGMMIDAAQIAVGFTAFSRGITTRSDGQIDEWLDDTKSWLNQAESAAVSGHWPMNDKSCHDYGGCPFRRVCNKDPSVRQNFLSTDFHIDPESINRILE